MKVMGWYLSMDRSMIIYGSLYDYLCREIHFTLTLLLQFSVLRACIVERHPLAFTDEHKWIYVYQIFHFQSINMGEKGCYKV